MRTYKTRTWNDRLKIAAWQAVGTNPQVMAEKLGLHLYGYVRFRLQEVDDERQRLSLCQPRRVA